MTYEYVEPPKLLKESSEFYNRLNIAVSRIQQFQRMTNPTDSRSREIWFAGAKPQGERERLFKEHEP